MKRSSSKSMASCACLPFFGSGPNRYSARHPSRVTCQGSSASAIALATPAVQRSAFDRMIPMAERWTAGGAKAIADAELPWHVTRLGCRAEYLFGAAEPKNGAEAHDAMDFELERFMHLYAMNRGILLTPFHNMALMSPQTEYYKVETENKIFREAVRELTTN